mmetsp:Transcript_72838/g.168841  ORF Transcript_72838/g.168841 Transcript_72838/m.168841 type:complete len:286 (-) Transcript_72838:520-1377(-)
MKASRGDNSSSAETSLLCRLALLNSLPASELPSCGALEHIFSQNHKRAPPDTQVANARWKPTSAKIIGTLRIKPFAMAMAFASCNQTSISRAVLSLARNSSSTAAATPGEKGGKTLVSVASSAPLKASTVEANIRDSSSASSVESKGHGAAAIWHASFGAKATAATMSQWSQSSPNAPRHTSRMTSNEDRMCSRARHLSTASSIGQDRRLQIGDTHTSRNIITADQTSDLSRLLAKRSGKSTSGALPKGSWKSPASQAARTLSMACGNESTPAERTTSTRSATLT